LARPLASGLASKRGMLIARGPKRAGDES
jgi:hypothetical protein